jgi:hypothetical protein
MAAALRAAWCCDLPVTADDERRTCRVPLSCCATGEPSAAVGKVAILLCVEGFPVLTDKQTTQLSEIARKVKTARKAGGPA